ncbi:MAG: hypothetical protein H8E05_00655 [Bacteroidetes bacterium]|nr:hypothetical protein [Bacteroidota bacterium]
MNNEYNYNETYEETYTSDIGEVEQLDKKTLKLIDELCEGVEVPSDEESKEAITQQHADSEWGQLARESARVDIIRTPYV